MGPEKGRTLLCGEEHRLTGFYPGVPEERGLNPSWAGTEA